MTGYPTHKTVKTKPYSVWDGIRTRCNNPKACNYANYGGKGAGGADSITLGLNAQAGAGTITIGDQIPIVPLMIRRLQPFWVVLMTPLNLAKP